MIPRPAHRHDKSPHMIKLDVDNGPGQANSLRGQRMPAPEELAGGHRFSPVRELTATVPRSQESWTRPDTAEGGDGYRRPIVAEIFHRPAAEHRAHGGARTCPDTKNAWARSGAWPPRAQTERARSLGPFEDDHALRFLSNAKTQL